MSKITFRADDDLVRAVESMDASKSEIMRDALREYLDQHRSGGEESLDELVTERVDAILDERLDARDARDINVNVTLDGQQAESAAPVRSSSREGGRDRRHTRSSGRTRRSGERTCAQCGEAVDTDHVFCPNCGEKASNHLFCECGDELRADWAFCPGCGRRTPSADVFEK